MKFLTLKSLKRDESGATMIEMALVSIPFFFLIMGAIEFGLIMHVSSVMANATAEASRLAITGNSYDDLRSGADERNMSRPQFIRYTIQKRLGSWYRPGRLDIRIRTTSSYGSVRGNRTVVTDAGGVGGSQDIVTYNVDYRWRVMTPIMSSIIGRDGNYIIRSVVVSMNEAY